MIPIPGSEFHVNFPHGTIGSYGGARPSPSYLRQHLIIPIPKSAHVVWQEIMKISFGFRLRIEFGDASSAALRTAPLKPPCAPHGSLTVV
jgi:hypothetical protein